MINHYEVGVLSTDQLVRDLWGNYDAPVIAILAQLANDPCYTQKFYKAPADDQEVFQPLEYKEYGMKVTPGSLIYGIYQPFPINTFSSSVSPVFAPYTVQVHDDSLDRNLFDDSISCLFLQNYKPTFQANFTNARAVDPGDAIRNQGSFPNLLCYPYPVVGSGIFTVQMQSISNLVERLELVFGVLEICG